MNPSGLHPSPASINLAVSSPSRVKMNELRSPLTDLLFLVVFCRMLYNIVAGILIFSVGRIRYRKKLSTRANARAGALPVIRGKTGSAVHLQSRPVYVIPVQSRPALVQASLEVRVVLLVSDTVYKLPVAL